LYVHVFAWPPGKLQLPAVKTPIVKAYLLAGKQPLRFEQSPEGLIVTLPKQPVDRIATVVYFETK
jgi:hypothetical protein